MKPDPSRRQPPAEIEFIPVRGHPKLPVEVVDRADVLTRMVGRSRQRPLFHQLVIVTAGEGMHEVDFDLIPLRRGSMIRVRPGQVQRFVPEPSVEATMLVWPEESHDASLQSQTWYPGSGVLTNWHLDEELCQRLLGWIAEIRGEQDRFTGAPAEAGLMVTLLRALLLRLSIELPESSPTMSTLPPAYVQFREIIEERLYSHPSVRALAHELGYSSRTVDRACQAVAGKTAKEVLDERTALEIRRLLTHSDRPVSRIGADLGFGDPSNFTKFVRRQLGRPPGEIRRDVLASAEDPPVLQPAR